MAGRASSKLTLQYVFGQGMAATAVTLGARPRITPSCTTGRPNCASVAGKIGRVGVFQLNQRKKATTKKEENDLISAFKHAKRTLDQQTEYESLLNISQLLRWSDLLLPRT